MPPESGSLEDSFDQFVQQNQMENSRSALNKFLVTRDISPVRSSLTTPWNDASERTRRYYIKKASEAVAASLEVMAPGESAEMLWSTLVNSQAIQKHFASASVEQESVDSALLESLAECYNNATQWDTRRQILSIMVDKISLKSLQQYIPDITPFRYKIATQHALLHGRGCPLPKPTQRRMRVPPEMVDHFISFITSQHIIQDLPFGQKRLKLSSGKVLIVPNVIRNMVPERLVQQYQAYCNESSLPCLGRSSLLRILEVCFASARTSLQGLDYFTASGAKAFDDLEDAADTLGDLGMGMSWAQQQKKQLKLAKRYLKGDFKVT